jgi:hypothetical protein
MTSAINTNGINVNYPVPGVNNSTQGFRDNFNSIKTNLDTASNEITNLQNSVVVKTALPGTTVNNDMANTLLSNVLTRSFRATTYNLGDNLNGTVTVNVSLGDVQYGTISANTNLQFGGWAPAGTQSNLQLILTFSNSDAVLSFPPQVINSQDSGVITLENYQNGSGNVATIKPTFDSNVIGLQFNTIDCGTNIYVQSTNRPRQSTQIQQRDFNPDGGLGDQVGTVTVDKYKAINIATCTATTAVTNYITCDSTSGFYLDMPIIFTGASFGQISTGTTYYVRSVISSTQFTISLAPGSFSGPNDVVKLDTASGTLTAYPISYLNIAGRNFSSNTVEKTSNVSTVETYVTTIDSTASSGNLISIGDTQYITINNPVTVNQSYGNLFTGITYYVKKIVDIYSFTVSSTIGGPELSLTDSGNQGTVATFQTGYTYTLNNVSNLYVNTPVVFVGNVFGGVTANSVYYINNVDVGNSKISISETYYSGKAGQTMKLTGGSNQFPMGVIAFNGNDIFNAVQLTPKVATANISAVNLSSQNYVIGGVDNFVATGTNKATSYHITKMYNVSTVTPGFSGIKLPIAQEGMRITIRNEDYTNQLAVYVNDGAQIDDLGINVVDYVPVSTTYEYFCSSSAIAGNGGQWYKY